jgi:hypothetical protein
MSYEELGFTASQWEALKRGPLYMLACVGGADSRIDSTEWSALLDAVVESAQADDALVREVMAALAADVRAGREFHLETPDSAAALLEIRDILGAWSERGLGYRTTLMEIGAAIAESSGAQLTMTYASRRGAGSGWALSSAVSAEEHAALETAAEALNLAVDAEVEEFGATPPEAITS